MEAQIVQTLVGIVGLSIVLLILVQLGKNFLPSVLDEEGTEIGPRRWLPPALLVIGTLLGIGVGFVRRDHLLDNGLLWMTAWGVAGFIIAASASGLYSSVSELLPGLFNDDGWLG